MTGEGKATGRAIALWASLTLICWGALHLLYGGTAHRLASTVSWIAGECVR